MVTVDLGKTDLDKSHTQNSSIHEAVSKVLASNPDFHCELTPWHYWSQLTDWVWRGGIDNNKSMNCLPESISMSLKYITDVELPAAYIKDVEYGTDYTGYTYFDAAQHFLRHYCGIATEVIWAESQDQYTYHVWDYICHGFCICDDRYFTAPGSTDRHIMPVVGIKQDVIVHADPWQGIPIFQSYADSWNWSTGWLLGIRRKRHV